VSAPLAIAIVCPTAWPPGDDIAWRVHGESAALARRGHRVTVFAPGTRSARTSGERLRPGGVVEPAAIRADPGTPRVIIVGRARKTGSRLGVSSFDAAAQLESAISEGAFDVIHVHEPLTPTPGISVLRRTTSVTATTFHRPDPMTGAAFLGPLVKGAMARVDIRIATSAAVERAVTQILGGHMIIMPWGTHAPAPGPERSRIAIVARGRDRAGLRFALAIVRLVTPRADGPITLMGPREAPWRVRTAVPKALRDRLDIVPDTGPESWDRLLAGAGVVVLGTPGDIDGPVTAQALADGCVVVAPRSAESDARLDDGTNAVVLAPYVRTPWVDALGALLDDPARRARIGAEARRGAPSWDAVAGMLETAYRDALGRHRSGHPMPEERVVADLRLRPTAGVDPGQMAAACWDAGLDVIAVASPDGVAVAGAIAAAAPPGLTVISGQEVATSEGVVVGLFLGADVPGGRSLSDTADLIHAQGGVVVIPHPTTPSSPSADLLRTLAQKIDCRELASPAGGPGQRPALRAAQELGIVVSAGSGAGTPDIVGTIGMRLRPFRDGRDFLDAVADGELIRPRRRRVRRTRSTRHAS
jgi:phosphatidylinositol alpha-mannosyltransferase